MRTGPIRRQPGFAGPSLSLESGDRYNPLRRILRLRSGQAAPSPFSWQGCLPPSNGRGRCHQLCETNPIFDRAKMILSGHKKGGYRRFAQWARCRSEPNLGDVDMPEFGKRGQVQPAARNVPVPVFLPRQIRNPKNSNDQIVPNKANFCLFLG